MYVTADCRVRASPQQDPCRQGLPKKAWRKQRQSIGNHPHGKTKAEPQLAATCAPSSMCWDCLQQLLACTAPGSRVQRRLISISKGSHWVEGPSQIQGKGFIYGCSVNYCTDLRGNKTNGSLSQTGKLEVLIYGSKDVLQTTLPAYVRVWLYVMNLEANQGQEGPSKEVKNCQCRQSRHDTDDSMSSRTQSNPPPTSSVQTQTGWQGGPQLGS